MSTNNNDDQKTLNDVHPFLEKLLIETYLQDKGYTMEALKSMSKEKAKGLMKEACTYASGKLTEVEVKARLREALHDAYINE